ncbi:MAG TPA: hypothetical protein P5218_14025, partial [Planctomycetota bacterium]|nr:hypothetical protein [Planctomycetota bacterium]
GIVAAAELHAALVGQGETEPDMDALASAFDELWGAQPEDSRLAKPGRYRITRGQGRVLQFCREYPASHVLRTAELSIGYSNPPGQLVIEKRGVDAQLFEPQTLLAPLPFADDSLQRWGEQDWEAPSSQWLRTSFHRSDARAAVRLDTYARPVGYWFQAGREAESVIAGFFEWPDAEALPTIPSRSITLYAQPGGIYGMMYRVTEASSGDPAIEPQLVVPEVSRCVDMRGTAPKWIDGPLPEVLDGLVRIE